MDSIPPRGKVLIVDDDELLREVMASALQLDNWATFEAQNGQEALEKIRCEKFDVMILDERMPEMTGRELYMQLILNKMTLPVILVTAAIDIEQIARELGILSYLAKPVSFIQLQEAVRQAFTDAC